MFAPLSRYSGRGVGGEGMFLPSPGTPGEGLGVRACLLPSPGTPGEGLGVRACLLPSPGTPGEGLGVRACLLPSPGTPGEGLGVRALLLPSTEGGMSCPPPLLTYCPDRFKYAVSIVKHLSIPKPDHLDTLQFQLSLPVRVLFISVQVCFAIHFDRQLEFEGEEIHNVRSNHLLASELETGKPTTTQFRPQDLLRGSHCSPQLSGSLWQQKILQHGSCLRLLMLFSLRLFPPSPGTPGEGSNMPSPPAALPEYRERGATCPHPQPLSRSTGRGEQHALTPKPSPPQGEQHALTPNPSPGVPGEGSKHALTPNPSPGVPGEGSKHALTPTPPPEYPGEGSKHALTPNASPGVPGVPGEGSNMPHPQPLSRSTGRGEQVRFYTR